MKSQIRKYKNNNNNNSLPGDKFDSLDNLWSILPAFYECIYANSLAPKKLKPLM